MHKKVLALFVSFVLACPVFALSACNKEETVELDPVTITIIGSTATNTAFETIGSKFKEKYSNCTIVYEYVNDYFNNATKRMSNDDDVDLFLSGGIQQDSERYANFSDYALNLLSTEDVDLSKTFEPLSENFRRREDQTVQYSVPLGGEMRGMMVNKTLLKSVGINTVPKNQTELLAACETLKKSGYVPMQGNPGSAFAQWLVYPWICSEIANSSNPDASRALVNEHNGASVRELIKEPYEFLYNLCEKGYYDYKYSQSTLNLFNSSFDEDYARHFLNIVKNTTTDKYELKDDSAGQVAFMPIPMSYLEVIEQTQKDYHSTIEYDFIPAPVDSDGGYVYLSPTNGIAINKNSKNLDWAIKFINFLFEPENNQVFAEESHILPNTANVYDYISNLYDVPEGNICHLGEATFTWDFYTASTKVAVVTSKANKPSTIASNNGKMIELDWYLDKLENAITTGVADTTETKS